MTTSRYVATFCSICGDKISVKEDDIWTICTPCARQDQYPCLPFELDGVNEIISNWRGYEQYLQDSDIYVEFDLFGIDFYYDFSKSFCSAFYKFKAIVCMGLNLHSKKKHADSIALDFWGSEDYWGEYWERGYELGHGVFSNWYITEL